ncbi:MAG: GNAT family N-acetyltransferase [Verrucomicrobiales bacterium]|nr:GNAT family N-acetyltransferase [Verrucomicrobiales bacterium]
MLSISPITAADLDPWLALRALLWPNDGPDALAEDAARTLADAHQAGFLARDGEGRPIGFIEVAIYRDVHSQNPRGHIEAWFVVPDRRGEGLGAALLAHAEQWCLHRAITLLTSDTHDGYPLSPVAHEGRGFRKLAELQIFVKELTG